MASEQPEWDRDNSRQGTSANPENLRQSKDSSSSNARDEGLSDTRTWSESSIGGPFYEEPDSRQAHAQESPSSETSKVRRERRADQGATRVERVAENDALAREKITDALTQLISRRSSVEPLAIGLFGPWGSGKSSQIEFVKKKLEDADSPVVRVAEFNAWHHEKSDNMGAALAQTVVDAMVGEMGFLEQLRLSFLLALRRHKRLHKALSKDAVRLGQRSYLMLVAAAPVLIPVALTFVIATIVADSMSLKYPWLSGGGLAGIAALWVGLHKFVTTNLTGWFKRFSGENQDLFTLPDFRSKLGTFHEIHSTLDNLLGLLLTPKPGEATQQNAHAKGEYLLLIVDDLDRCGAQTVKHVFDAVRLVARIPRVVTLLAIDDRIAFASVEKYFDQFGVAGREPAQVARDYLGKVFQVAITLPKVSETEAREFVTSELFKDELKASVEPETKQPDSPPETPVWGEFASVTQQEVTLFSEMAERTGVSNPRDLWRLKQAWLLLKALAITDGADFWEIEPWMRSLFVREWALSATADERAWMGRNRGVPVVNSTCPYDRSPQAILAMDNDCGSDRRHAIVEIVLLPASSSRPTRARPTDESGIALY